jgi:hypothetical protein
MTDVDFAHTPRAEASRRRKARALADAAIALGLRDEDLTPPEGIRHRAAVVIAAGVNAPHDDDTWFVVHELMAQAGTSAPAPSVPHLAIPGNGQSLDERRVARLRAFLQPFEVSSPAVPLLPDFEAILAARVMLPVLPSWAHLVAEQPCMEIRCSGCGYQYDAEADFIRHFDDLDDARRALSDALVDDDDDADDPSWLLVADELLCHDCRVARHEESGEEP